MHKETLKFNDTVVGKKDFYFSKSNSFKFSDYKKHSCFLQS